MKTLFKNITAALAVILTSATIAGVANAQVLIIDGQRIQEEAEAYKDVMSKTAVLRNQITALSKYVDQRNGDWIAEAQEIEKKKSIVGQKKYEEEVKALDTKVKTAARNLIILRSRLENIVAEANRQIERASKPLTKSLLTKYKAQILLYKQTVIRHAAGLDKTTEFIEMLNDSLPAVNIATTPAPKADAKKDAAKPAAKK